MYLKTGTKQMGGCIGKCKYERKPIRQLIKIYRDIKEDLKELTPLQLKGLHTIELVQKKLVVYYKVTIRIEKINPINVEKST